MTEYTFAAWDRSGAAASLADPDDLTRTTPVRGQLKATASAVVNDAAQIRADRRLYMTATPRSFAAPEISESASLVRPRGYRPAGETAGGSANSMDNEVVYGKLIHDYPLASAIADGGLPDRGPHSQRRRHAYVAQPPHPRHHPPRR